MERANQLATPTDPLLACCMCKNLPREAVQLKCLHNCCRQCFSAIASTVGNKGVGCGLCRLVTEKGAEQPNGFIDSQVQRYRRIAGFGVCDVCEGNGEHNKPALVWCPTCRHSLCGDCIAGHRQYNRQHVTQSLEELNSLDEVCDKPSASSCPIHKKPLDIACLNCKQAKCFSCWIDCNEKKHEVLAVGQDSFNSYVGKLIFSIASEESELLRKSEVLENPKRLLRDTQAARDRHLDEISMRKRCIVDAVETVYQEIALATKNAYDDLQAESDAAAAAAERFATDLLEARNYISRLVDSNNKCEIINQQKNIRERLNVLSVEVNRLKDFLTATNRDVQIEASLPEDVADVVRSWIGVPRMCTGEKSGGNLSFEPQVYFKPVMPLPELVEVRTGEEDEEVMFAERACLYRFDKATNQWKERGLGVLKVLRSVAQQQQYRVVMRRDQVHKLCANHLVSAYMELKPMQGNAKAWCWFASDFSEGIVSNGHLAARFRSEELAKQFKAVVVECCKNLSQKVSSSRASGKPDAPASVAAPNAADVTAASAGDKAAGGNVASVAAQSKPAAAAQQPLSAELLKPPAGKWSCMKCLVINSGSEQRCACCQTLRSGATPTSACAQDVKPAVSSAASSGIRFCGQSTTSAFNVLSTVSLFGSQPTVSLFGGQTTAPRFGTPSTATPTSHGLFAPVTAAGNEASLFGSVSSSGSQTKSFVFGGQHGSTVALTTFTFGLSKGPLAKDAVAAPDKGVRRSAVSNSGSSQQQPTTSMTPIGRQRATSTGQEPTSPDLYVNKSCEDDHINFAPVVELPENVELATGEENEDVLYVHRATLFRFTNGEWKERVIGDVKLLRHCQSKRVRIIMRCEQTLKLCLNHYVTTSLECLPMAGSEGKSYIWSAMDFVEGEGVIKQFALRFKDASVASEFKRAFDGARLRQGSELPPIGNSTPSAPHQPAARVGTDSASKESASGSVVSMSSSSRSAAAALFDAARLQSPGISLFGKPSLSGSSTLSCLPNRRNADQFDEGFGGVGHGKPWAGAGTTMFGSVNKQTPKNEKGGSNNDDDNEEDDKNAEQSTDDIQLKPVLKKLPDLIDVKTGEESEVVEFCQQCKLYRFAAPSTQPAGPASTCQNASNQWIERGVGEIKLLRDPATGTVRVVMRRDQVLNLACNHLLTSDMKLCPLATCKQAWCWEAMDYSENVLKPEHFAAKFKSIPLAKEFKLAFERCKAALGTPCLQSATPADKSSGKAVEPATSRGIDASCVDSLASEVRSATAEAPVAASTIFEKRSAAIELKDGASLRAVSRKT